MLGRGEMQAASPRASGPLAPSVRHASEADAAAIARVQVASWRVAYAGLFDEAVFEARGVLPRTRLWERLPQLQPPVFVAERAGAVIGIAHGGPARVAGLDADVAELYVLYVDPDHWRGGVGAALLAAVEDNLRMRGFSAIVLWVLAENPIGRAFYARQGYEPDGAQITHAGSGRLELRLRRRL